MPEGDSIHRIANRLADLVGATIERAATQGLARAALAGQPITAIEAHGKHLVIDVANGTQIRAHLGLYGKFRRLARAAGDTMLARSSPGRISLALVLPDAVLLWIGAKTIEITDRRAPLRGLAVAQLGPDILAPDFDPAAAAARIPGDDPRPIATVLLDQRIAAGIGNVYKSEILFLLGLDPRTPTSAVPLATRVAAFAEAQRLMVPNIGPRLRTRQTTTLDAPVRSADDRYFVYGRTNQPCRRCASLVVCFSLGDPPRWTWACPTCQPLS